MCGGSVQYIVSQSFSALLWQRGSQDDRAFRSTIWEPKTTCKDSDGANHTEPALGNICTFLVFQASLYLCLGSPVSLETPHHQLLP